MTRVDYINRLRRELSQMPQNELEDIILDYEEHFDMALSAGKTEEEVSASLGAPETIARQFKVTQAIKTAEETKTTGNLLRAIIMTVSLSFFNIVFLLGPFIAFCGIIIAFFAVGVALVVAGGAVMFSALVGTSFIAVSLPVGIPLLGLFAMGVMFVGIGLLTIFVMVHISRVFYDLVLRYLKANASLIKN